MIRVTALWLYVIGFAVYAQRDWYKALCALVLLTAVVEHPDMPKTLFGIQGLNPWNVLFGAVFVAWLKARRQEGLTWDFPRHISVMLLLYLGVVLVSATRMMLDAELLDLTFAGMVSEYLINPIKWVLPGLLLYDGARNLARFRIGAVCVLGMYFLLALQVIRWMPLSAAMSGDSLGERSAKILVNEVGYHRVNMSAMLAGASWAILAARPLATVPRYRHAVLAASAITVLGQALTAGRAGYLTWIAVGGVLSLIRWRKYLLLAPVLVIGVLTLAPGVAERMLEGFDSGPQQQGPLTGEAGRDTYTITAGRNLAWPLVIGKIGERPIVGWGREAMTRTGIKAYLWQFKEGFSHPHNAYLELLLDNGFIGFVIVMPFYVLVLWRSISLFRDSRDPVFVAAGGISAAFLLALLISAMSSQTFYPREGWMGMWCAIGLMVRVAVARDRQHALEPFSGPRAPESLVRRATHSGTSPDSASRRAPLRPGARIRPAAEPEFAQTARAADGGPAFGRDALRGTTARSSEMSPPRFRRDGHGTRRPKVAK